jgi:REP element-mobilizing transposase RayT
MADSFTQLIIQFVFSVYGRRPLVQEEQRERIEKYICGVISGMQSKPIAIYCNPDHLHILVGLNPAVSVSETARMIKSESTKFINDQRLTSEVFKWQGGYGAFTYNRRNMGVIVEYIRNQRAHHARKTYEKEYLALLKANEIEIGRKIIFDPTDFPT